MRQPPRPILELTKSILAEGPLTGRVPIGQFHEVGPTASRRFSAFTSQHVNRTARAKRWQGATRHREITSSARCWNSWERVPNGVASTPKRSNTGPLLGVLFGASALAYLGSSLLGQVGVQDSPIESSDGVDITDTDGK